MIKRDNAGFANPEYMIVLTIMLIILSVAVPKVAELRERSRNLKALATLRSALARYAADTKTKGPADLSELTKGAKYLAEIPPVGLRGHHDRSAQVYPFQVGGDAGGWSYSSPTGAYEGVGIWINCTHTDSRGRAWNTY